MARPSEKKQQPASSDCPTLHQYRSFHSMVCSPRIARACVDSFVQTGGIVLFMPFDYALSPDEAAAKDWICPYDCSGTLNTLTYYLLVIFSLTGLSTLLGMTEFVDSREMDGRNSDVTSLCSIRDPAVRVNASHLRYVAQKSGVEPTAIRLRRRFEFDFRLVGLNVIMLHFSCPKEGKCSDEAVEWEDTTHLVEVVRLRHPVMRFTFQFLWNVIVFSGQIYRGMFGRRPALAGKGREKDE